MRFSERRLKRIRELKAIHDFVEMRQAMDPMVAVEVVAEVDEDEPGLEIEAAEAGTAWSMVEERFFSWEFPGWYGERLSCGHGEFCFYSFSQRDYSYGNSGLAGGMRVCRLCTSAQRRTG